MRVATIDIGTNSVLLLVAERRGAELFPLVERSTITRLGQDVDRTRRLHPEAVERTLACLNDYARIIQSHDVDAVACVATSASRDASGAETFVARAREVLGVAPAVISGQREAELTFAGALVGLGLDGPVAIQDVGGGSTELVLGEAGAGGVRVIEAVSLDVGSVRMTERFLGTDPPTSSQLAELRGAVRVELAKAPRIPRGTVWVGIAGTITTLAAIDQELIPYDAGRVHGSRLECERIGQLTDKLAGLPLEQRRRVPGLEPKRADVIVAGACIAHEVLLRSDAASLVVSDRGVRWGVAQELAGLGGSGASSVHDNFVLPNHSSHET